MKLNTTYFGRQEPRHSQCRDDFETRASFREARLRRVPHPSLVRVRFLALSIGTFCFLLPFELPRFERNPALIRITTK